jgi:acyl-CoA thioesterase-1
MEAPRRLAARVARAVGSRWPRLRPLLPAALLAAAWPSCSAGDGPLVAFLGDSLTSGWRLHEDEAYPALVARALADRGRPIRVLNAGVSGDTAAQGLARLPEVLNRRPNVLVVALGVNDALVGLPLDATERSLERIVDESRAAGARVLLVGCHLASGPEAPRAGAAAGDAARARRLAEIHTRLAASHRLPLVPDLLRGVAGEPTLLFPDRLHPNAAGQARLAETVRPHLELVLAEVEAGSR